MKEVKGENQISHRHTLLAVDDNRNNLSLLSDYFEVFGFRVLTARDGEGALESVQHTLPDLILLDVMMPGIDGFETCQRLKADNQLKDIPVIFMTALSDTKDKIRAYQLGGVDYITKPFQPEEVMARVMTHLRLTGLTRNLEKQVAERTQELTTSNQKLNLEIAERKKVEQRLREVMDDLENRVEMRTSELRDAVNKLTVEIAERRQAETNLQESKSEYKALYQMMRRLCDNVPDMIWAKDMDGRYIFANKAICDDLLNAKDTDEPIGKTDRFFMARERNSHPDEAHWHDFGEICVDSDEVIKKSGKAGQFDEFGNVKGQFLYLDVQKAPIFDNNGEMVGVVGSGRDVTQRKMLESQLRHAHKMEAIGTLAGGIAHEFNNVLGIIIGNVELAMDDIPQEDPTREFLEEIKEASYRATEVIKQILSYARKTPHNKQPAHINTIVQNAVKLLRSSIPITVSIHHHLMVKGDMLLCDESEINQVILHLCINSAQSMPDEKGRVDIRLESVQLNPAAAEKLDGITSGRYIKLTIEDNGPGIEASIQERIFDPFFSTKDVDQGSGMGLSIVYGIIKRHDGAIEVSSQKNKGTIFEVLLPAIEEEPVERIKSTEPTPYRGGTILLVDDEEPLVRMIEKTLTRLGYQVLVASNSIQALKLFRENAQKIDLVIADITMPLMPGDELAAEILQIRADIPIVFCTGNSDRIDPQSALEKGGKALLMKPLDRNKLVTIVENLLHPTL